MSLTGHLHSPTRLRAWWEARSDGLAEACQQIAASVRRPAGRLSIAGRDHAATVGTIVGRMIEQDVEPSPPYAAIYGGGSNADALIYPTHRHLAGTEYEPWAAGWRPTPAGGELLMKHRDTPRAQDLVTWATQVETSPGVTVADRATAAGVLSIAESLYRAGVRGDLTDEAVTDSARIYHRMSHSRQRAAELCGGVLRGHAQPTMAPHWADADLVLGPGLGGGYCLVEVKTVGDSTVTNPDRTVAWLWQLLSYAAADANDSTWRISAVGVWATRQDALTVWPLDQLWSQARLGADAQRSLRSLIVDAYRRDATEAGL